MKIVKMINNSSLRTLRNPLRTLRESLLFALILTFLTTGISNGQSLNIDSCYKLARENYPMIKQLQLVENCLRQGPRGGG